MKQERPKRGRAGDDLAHLRAQLGRNTPVSQPVEPEPALEPEGDPAVEANAESARADTRATKRRAPTPAAGSAPRGNGRGSRGSMKPQEKPRRITVDLDADRYRVLREFAFEERTKGTEVLRGLLDMLRDDPKLAEGLRERLAAGEG
ncbi:MAG: hypothetical protein M3P49_04670 [Actinomycetota bacterium]|nr:hypothetical protein [Actinomycetota bacterium]